ncbi:hypothetical protein MFRU_010g01350 [Monilinia fructicola]|nr:hypothetical protein MFRU_010g01350 [Monilinia fructicola]
MSDYYRPQGQFHQGLVHLEGLEKMVNMRAGISNLEKEQIDIGPILQTHFIWAFRRGTPFKMFNPKAPSISGQTVTQICTKGLNDLRDILIKISYISRLTNEALAGFLPPLDSLCALHSFIFLGYRLLDTTSRGFSS